MERNSSMGRVIRFTGLQSKGSGERTAMKTVTIPLHFVCVSTLYFTGLYR